MGSPANKPVCDQYGSGDLMPSIHGIPKPDLTNDGWPRRFQFGRWRRAGCPPLGAHWGVVPPAGKQGLDNHRPTLGISPLPQSSMKRAKPGFCPLLSPKIKFSYMVVGGFEIGAEKKSSACP